MAKEEWGTKRVCPDTGKRFYDLNNNPVISPYTGKEIILDKSASSKIKEKTKSAESQQDTSFEESDELLSMDDDLILDEEAESSELDDELLEEDEHDTVPLEEITDVPSSESEEN
tara:strand:- start:376 stop:720 length:345 start_codon:yes stop_codon:yes gene_type:complete